MRERCTIIHNANRQLTPYARSVQFHDHLTYHPNYQGKGSDYIEFNGHKRDLGPGGGQGMRFEGQEEAERVCGRVCGEQIGGGVFGVEGERGRSRQVVYGGVDDMCDGCK
jgi:hypothetical protein